MIIDQNEHEECFFKIYEEMGVVNFDFLTDRKINLEEVKEKIMKIMDSCTKVIFLAQRLEQNETK